MPDTEITRAETGERAQLLHVRSYDVDLDFTRGPQTFGSVSVIRFDCHEPGSTSHADLIATGILEITLNGVSLDPQTVCADGRIMLPALAARNELRVAADCAYTTSGTDMHRADSADGSSWRTDGHASRSYSPREAPNHEREVRAPAGRQK
jgi:aminopeptidase N